MMKFWVQILNLPDDQKWLPGRLLWRRYFLLQPFCTCFVLVFVTLAHGLVLRATLFVFLMGFFMSSELEQESCELLRLYIRFTIDSVWIYGIRRSVVGFAWLLKLVDGRLLLDVYFEQVIRRRFRLIQAERRSVLSGLAGDW